MKRILTILLIALVVPLFSANSLSGQSGTGKLEGIWKMKSQESGLQVEFSVNEKNNEGEKNSITVSKSALDGYTGNRNSGFLLKKSGGEIRITGDITAENGEGTFVFVPNDSYIKSLADEGI